MASPRWSPLAEQAGTPRGSINRRLSAEGAALPTGPLVAGVLHKWGVLSYMKVEGPTKISIIAELQRRPELMLIGDEVRRLLKKERAGGGPGGSGHTPVGSPARRKLFGELSLQVSTLRPSNADEKKFYVDSGTRTLHLRAECKEDRMAWLEALSVSKDLAGNPLAMLPPAEDLPVSTERLRERMAEAGCDEALIADCEGIVHDLVAEMQAELRDHKQKRHRLVERVNELEADKVELETRMIDDADASRLAAGAIRQDSGHNNSSGLLTREMGVLRIARYPHAQHVCRQQHRQVQDQHTAHCHRPTWVGPPATPGKAAAALEGLHIPTPEEIAALDMEKVGFTYPYVKRREKLPDAMFKEKSVSLWSIIKDNVGKDLSKVCLPVYFNEPISTLQRCFEELEYSWLLDRAAEYGRRGNPLMRAIHVAAFAISSYACTEGRSNKPFNPLLGETYEADWPDKGLRFFSEKVSHHPTIVACACQGVEWKFWGDCNLKSKFWGRSIQLDPVGVLTLEFIDGERFEWSKVTTSIYNIILGKLYSDHYGTMRINGNRGFSARLKFKEQSLMDRNPRQVQGHVVNARGENVAAILGKWDHSVYYVMGDLGKKAKATDVENMEDAVLVWQRSPPSKHPLRYGLTSFAITLNEILPGLREKLPPTDSRLRPDQRLLENGQFDEANSEKLRLEQRQRVARKAQEAGWEPRWFKKQGPHGTFTYQGGYWEAREHGDWSGCADIFSTSDPLNEEGKSVN
eukprot:SM000354S13410  [mRNA]  locus=s354:37052:41462:- [translate_table: standard]